MFIALVFPKSTFLEDPMVFPPLGLWYLAAQLEAQGHTTTFIPLDVSAGMRAPLRDGLYDQVWISATSPQMHEVRKLSEMMKGWKTPTVLGGPAVWTNMAQCEALNFTVCVGGEADHPRTVEYIVDLARGGTKTSHYAEITQGPLDWVLPPIRMWSHLYDAHLVDREGKSHRTTTMFTSRGCPMACAFCESGRNGVIWDRFVRYEPVELVVEQVREIRERHHTGIMFYDDILPLNKPRTLEILEVLRRYGMVWRCFLRTDVITKQGGYDYLRDMRDAGLLEVLVGVESADQRIKDGIHKGTTIEQDTQVLEWCKQLGIRFKASFILGLPGEDEDSMQATRNWILEHRPDRVDVNTLIPFPGTPITGHANPKNSKYDLEWEEELPEEFFYKGYRHTVNALVHTSALTAQRIGEFRSQLVSEIESLGFAMAIADPVEVRRNGSTS